MYVCEDQHSFGKSSLPRCCIMECSCTIFILPQIQNHDNEITRQKFTFGCSMDLPATSSETQGQIVGQRKTGAGEQTASEGEGAGAGRKGAGGQTALPPFLAAPSMSVVLSPLSPVSHLPQVSQLVSLCFFYCLEASIGRDYQNRGDCLGEERISVVSLSCF